MDTLASQQVIHAFGYERTSYVLANTIQLKDWDARFSRDNKIWAQSVQIAGGDEGIRDHRWRFVVGKSHPGLTDMFTAMVRHDQEANRNQRVSVRELLKTHTNTSAKSEKTRKPKEEIR